MVPLDLGLAVETELHVGIHVCVHHSQCCVLKQHMHIHVFIALYIPKRKPYYTQQSTILYVSLEIIKFSDR